MRLKRSRMRPVLRKSRCRSSTMIRKMRPAASLRGRDGGRMMPSCVGGGGGASRLCTRPPCTSVNDVMSCLTPSSKTSKSSLRQVGDELVLVVPDDDVHGDQVDGRRGNPAVACCGWSAACGRLCRRGLRGLAGRRLSGQDRAPTRPSSQNQTPAPRRIRLDLHTRQYKTNGPAFPDGLDDDTIETPMRVAVGADHAGLRNETRSGRRPGPAGPRNPRSGHAFERAGRLPRHRRSRRDRHPQRSGRPRHHRLRQRRRRLGRGLQVPRRPRGRLPRLLHGAARPSSTTTSTCCAWARGSSARRSPARWSKTFLAATFPAEERHLRRLAKIDASNRNSRANNSDALSSCVAPIAWLRGRCSSSAAASPARLPEFAAWVQSARRLGADRVHRSATASRPSSSRPPFC